MYVCLQIYLHAQICSNQVADGYVKATSFQLSACRTHWKCDRLDDCWKWINGGSAGSTSILQQSTKRCPRDNESITTQAEQSTTLTTPTTLTQQQQQNTAQAHQMSICVIIMPAKPRPLPTSPQRSAYSIRRVIGSSAFDVHQQQVWFCFHYFFSTFRLFVSF